MTLSLSDDGMGPVAVTTSLGLLWDCLTGVVATLGSWLT